MRAECLVSSPSSRQPSLAIPVSDVWARALPFAAFIAVLAVRSFLPEWTLGFDARWLYAVQAAVPALLLIALWPRFIELHSSPRSTAQWAVAVALGVAVLVIWINATDPWMRLGSPTTTFIPVSEDGSLRWDLIAIRLIGAAVVVPLIEELFWRSFVMRTLDRRDFLALPPAQTSRFALIASSAVFALEHDLWLAGFIAGLAYGWLYVRTQNLWYPVVAHGLTNLILGIWVVGGRHWQFW